MTDCPTVECLDRGNDVPSKTYVYNQLAHVTSIRLLELRPGIDDQIICCDLISVDLLEFPSYEAISYMWGDISNIASIICDGCVLPVPSSLVVTLKRLRHATQTRILWADAISINQGNISEKNQQVRLMGSIFKHASRVLAWLGDDGGNSRAAFELVNRVEAWMKHNWDGEALHTVPKASAHDTIWSDLDAWRAFAKFSDCRYFKRAWIQQEVGLGRCVTMYWGNNDVSWAKMSHMVRFLKHNYLVLDSQLGHGSVQHAFMSTYILYAENDNIAHLGDSNSDVQTEKKSSPFVNDFWAVLDIARGLQFLDARDVVYAFLGHPTALRSHGSTVVEASYDRTAEELYKEIAIEGLIENKNSRVFAAVEHSLEPKPKSTPSWVPNLSKALKAPAFQGRYRAGLDVTLNVTLSECGNAIVLQGYVLDAVIEHTEAMRSGITVRNGMTQILDVIKNAETSSPNSPYFGLNIIPSHLLDLDYHLNRYGSGQAEFYDHGPYFNINRRAQSETDKQMNRPDPKTASAQFFEAPLAFCNNRKAFRTSRGYVGLGPQILERGDLVTIISGADLPLVLRRKEDHYILIGAPWVFGIMNGEAMKEFLEGQHEATRFVVF